MRQGSHAGGTDGRRSSAFVVRALGTLVVLLVAAAGILVAALTSQGDAVLPVEQGVEMPGELAGEDEPDPARLPTERSLRQGSS